MNKKNKLFISPPFGNYLTLPKCNSIRGSFTLQPRDGLFLQILKTLRYSFIHKGWVNKIGLRNNGIDWAINKYKNTNDIISIAILNEDEIQHFINKIPENMNLEINISCPNTEHDLISNNLNGFLNNKREWCCIKLSPHTDMNLIDKYYQQGFRQFHCSNTLPINENDLLYKISGGLSGVSLIPYTSNITKTIKHKYPDVEVISGGGIRNLNTLKHYEKCGADYFSVSSVIFNPFVFTYFYFKYYNYKN